VRKALAGNFNAWVDAVERCLLEADLRMPNRRDRRELAEFVLTTMEGGVMQARTHCDVAYFDCAVRQLRTYFGYLERDTARVPASVPRAAAGGILPGRTPRKRKPGRKRGAG
jgi:TetR/AcrR family transcriptional regulator, transcriptional repressor for nem operon